MRAHSAGEIRNQRQRIARIKEQQERLLDAFLDGALSKYYKTLLAGRRGQTSNPEVLAMQLIELLSIEE